MNRLALAASALLFLTACVQAPPPKETVRICDDQGCGERPRGYSSFDPASAVPDDDPTGRIARLKAVAESDPRAAYDLGLRYFRGDGVTQDSYQALVWMRKAAEHGNLKAQKALGRFYLTGLEEMGSDPQEAEKWLSIAASKGDKESKKLLAEATAAKKADAEYYKWQTRWREESYRYWHSGYPYLGYWRQGLWYFY
ncbi:MAG: sel1 repeat family protein [Zoogloeaceae bacterium]|nr:sel1 repeat family protein [Zoogloeaceae bacterium]